MATQETGKLPHCLASFFEPQLKYSYRKNLTAWHNGDALVQAVAANNSNTIVVVHSVGPLILEPWIDHPNVTAVVWAGLGGSETGNSLVDVLYGYVNPSGRLPYTIAKSPSDYPAQLTTGGSGDEILDITYTEGYVLPHKLSRPLKYPSNRFLFLFFTVDCSSTIATLTRRISRHATNLVSV
jgi:Glycosyl hydrolase family 3 C-terminal domain